MDFNKKYFDPLAAGGDLLDEEGSVSFRAGNNPEDVYVYKPKTVLALNVALATRRPLLISGEPGSGKSTLAKNATDVLGWWYYKQMVTSRTQSSDFLWTFDTLRRLNDAQAKKTLRNEQCYVNPGTLWWAFDPNTAKQRGFGNEVSPQFHAINPGIPALTEKAVVLVDEIDKADPDVPNDLLEPFDLMSFTVSETNDRITLKRDVLLILTTNGERELPPAFLRRCVCLTLDTPSEKWFVEIADRKLGKSNSTLHLDVAREVVRLRTAAHQLGIRQPSTGEYLDALKVCRDLSIDTKSKVWEETAREVLWKHERPPELKEVS